MPYANPQERRQQTGDFSNQALLFDTLRALDHIGIHAVVRPPEATLLADAKPVGTTKQKPYSPPVMSVTLDLSDQRFQDYFGSKLKPLGKNPSQEEVFDALSQLYTLLKTSFHGGTLGIEYQDSTGRLPKTPDAVLTPDNDKKLRADCDELALLFFFTAKKLNIPVESIGFLDVALQTKGRFDENTTERLHIAVVTIGDRKLIFDPTFGVQGELGSLNFLDINRFYAGKQTLGGLGAATIIGVQDNVHVFTGENGAYAIHYMESGATYNNQRDYERAYAAYSKAYELAPTEECRYRLTKACLNAGEMAYDSRAYVKAEFYFAKALQLNTTNPQIKEKFVMALAMQNNPAKNPDVFRLCDELITTNPEYHKFKVWAAMQIGDRAVELAAFKDWARTAKSEEVFEQAVQFCLQNKSYEDGLILCQDWAKAFPLSSLPYIEKARILFKLGADAYNVHDPLLLPSAEKYLRETVDSCNEGLKPAYWNDQETIRELNRIKTNAMSALESITRKK